MNGEDDQPRFAGLDEAKTVPAENVPVAVETTAEVPSEAKSMGEVVPAPAAAERNGKLSPHRRRSRRNRKSSRRPRQLKRNRKWSRRWRHLKRNRRWPPELAALSPFLGHNRTGSRRFLIRRRLSQQRKPSRKKKLRFIIPRAAEGRAKRRASRNVGRFLAAPDRRLSLPDASLMTQLPQSRSGAFFDLLARG